MKGRGFYSPSFVHHHYVLRFTFYALEQAGVMDKIGFVFPGQGSQFVGMGRDIYENSEAGRRVFDAADRVLGFSLTTLCFEGPADKLNDTQYAQPAILTMSVAQLEALREKWSQSSVSIEPKYVAGHSLREANALVAAGSLKIEDTLRLGGQGGRPKKQEDQRRLGGQAAVL